MKRVITGASYSKVLRDIYNELKADGLNVMINQQHNCVDVLDKNFNVVEQHYPEFDKDRKSRRGKFVYVGPGNGDYILTRVEYDRKEYKKSNHLIKHVNRTSRYNHN